MAPERHALAFPLFFSDIDDCAGKTCNEVGQCQDGINDYICQCNLGYTGKDCQTSEEPESVT